jgi:hypothetical protein
VGLYGTTTEGRKSPETVSFKLESHDGCCADPGPLTAIQINNAGKEARRRSGSLLHFSNKLVGKLHYCVHGTVSKMREMEG